MAAEDRHNSPGKLFQGAWQQRKYQGAWRHQDTSTPPEYCYVQPPIKNWFVTSEHGTFRHDPEEVRVVMSRDRKRLKEIEEELARLRALPVGIVYKHILVIEFDGPPPQEDSGDEVEEDREVLIRTITAR